MRVFALIGVILSASLAGVLLSGKATVNFTHTPILEQIRILKHYKVVRTDNGYNVYLSGSISSPNNYRGLLNMLFTARKGTVITLYLAGNGGNAESMAQIVNAVRNSKAHIICYVYGPVRSAHAVISINGDELKLASPHLNFLFHRIALGRNALLVDDYCSTVDEKAKDRGMSAKNKCFSILRAYEQYIMSATMSRMVKVMTKDELKRFKAGDDVLIKAGVLKKRLNKEYDL